MAELADATDSKSVVRKGVWVQVPLRAHFSPQPKGGFAEGAKAPDAIRLLDGK